MKTKGELRKAVLKKRMSLSDIEVLDKSQRIIHTIFNLDKFKNSKNIMCYIDFKKEVSTKRLITEAIAMGKQVSVPYITDIKDQNNIMVAAIIRDYELLEKGTYGIYAPQKEGLISMDPNSIDLIIVPGVAFDLNMNRIGYGAGYYDRFLRLLRPDCLKVGIAFEIQIIDEIPIETFDIQLDHIVTEDRVI